MLELDQKITPLNGLFHDACDISMDEFDRKKMYLGDPKLKDPFTQTHTSAPHTTAILIDLPQLTIT